MEFNRIKVAKFQEQDCSLKLREAVEEFYSINSHCFAKPDPKTSWSNLLVYHDVGHVFFGVNISVLDEAAGDYWTLFGTDMTFKEYLEYAKTPEAKELINQMGPKLIIKSMIYSLPSFFRILMRSKQMREKWKLHEYEKYVDVPLNKLRRSYNLKILEY